MTTQATTTESMEERFRLKFPFAILDYRPGHENDGDGLATDKMLEILDFIKEEITRAIQEDRARSREEIGRLWVHILPHENFGLSSGNYLEKESVLTILK